MKTILSLLNTIDLLLSRWILSYIHKVSKVLYPRTDIESEDDDDDEPILFI